MNAPAELERQATTLLRDHGTRVEDYLKHALSTYPGSPPPRLIESITYSLLAGGKRLRPALILECAHACQSKNEKTEDRSQKTEVRREGPSSLPALAAAAAMELIHTFSLVHDDLPAMDDDDLRRGRPTNHKVFGEAMAILAGDAMTTLAFELLARDGGPSAARLVAELAHASGPAGMIGGQVLDIDGEGTSLSLPDLQRLHRMKTGALLRASCRLGALAAGATEPQLAAVTRFGEHLGLAFQIVDDILDVTSTPEQMGKATGKDAAKGKNTYPSLLGLDASKEQAQQQLHAAHAALQPLGPSAAGLKIIADFVVQRTV